MALDSQLLASRHLSHEVQLIAASHVHKFQLKDLRTQADLHLAVNNKPAVWSAAFQNKHDVMAIHQVTCCPVVNECSKKIINSDQWKS